MLKRIILLSFLLVGLSPAFSQTFLGCCDFFFKDTIRLCEGDNVFITIKGGVGDSTTIKWEGPGFTSTDTFLIIQHISPSKAGYYIANISCPSKLVPGAYNGCGQGHLILVTPKQANAITATVCPTHPYIFSNGSSNSTPGTYYDTLHSVLVCDSIVTILLKNFRSKDTLQAAICPGESHLLPDGRRVNASGIYTSTLMAQNGCDSLVYTQVQQVAGNIGATVPNTFTPNGDGLNDVFRIKNLPQQRFVSLQVYNRYSQIIFSTRNATGFWNGLFKGKPQPAGSYVYLLQYINCMGKLQQTKGSIILMR
ncbi:MAG: gliding motility-associated C-terminal domain-containing protein [Ferruginibacter sp.]|nr:gliding motility-associated C-terminal domain-containing protein [Ferruginibacter sp.]